MSVFILLAGIITVITLGLLVLPLLGTRNPIAYQRQEQNIHFAKERLHELEEQLANATISATDYEALKLEIESNLAGDIDIGAQPPTDDEHRETKQSNLRLVIGLCTVLPLFAMMSYAWLGTPDAVDQTQQQNAEPSPENIEAMLVAVEQRLAKDPNDVEGWTVLSSTYLAMGRFDEAERGFLKLLEVGGESANVYAQLADTLALRGNGVVNDDAFDYIEKALALNHLQPQALWLAGLHASQNNQGEQAREYWGQLLPLLAQAPQQQQELQIMINQALAGNSSPAPVSKEALPSPDPVPVVDLNVDVNLSVAVSIAPELESIVDPEDIVFVFARGQNGPPPPLAVKRLRVKDLPTQITLGDTDAMVPQLKLSLFEDIKLTARISKSGNPIAQSGDIESESVDTTNTETQTIDLLISRPIE